MKEPLLDEELSPNAKHWFELLLDEEIENERGTVENEGEWAVGASTWEAGGAHWANAKEHFGYLRFLEGLKARYCGAS